MKPKNWLFSLWFPCLSILTFIIYTIALSPFLQKYGLQYVVFTFVFGFVIGGIVPLAFILIKKIDISIYIKRKMLSSIFHVIVSIVSFAFLLNEALSILIYVVPSVMIIIEIRYSIIHCNNVNEKLTTILASPIIPYFGVLLDVSHAFSTTVSF